MRFYRFISLLLLAGAADAQGAGALEIHGDKPGNIFDVNEQISMHLTGVSKPVVWSIIDFFGQEVAAGRAVGARESADITVASPGAGYFTLMAAEEGSADGKNQTAFAVLAPPPNMDGTSPFGVVTHFAKGWDPAIIPLIARAGIKHVRDEQPWRKVEKTPATYRFEPRLTNYMAGLEKYHLDSLIELAFSNPLYDDDQTPFSETGRQGYSDYANAVVDQYRAPLDHDGGVEIWNEYNGSFCAGPCKQDPPRFYAAMLSSAYRAIKKTAPHLTVAGGAGVPIPLPFYRKLFQLGALDSMDVLVIHPYRKTPEGVEDKIAELRQMMAEFGPIKPVWATEFGDLADMKKSRDDVARYLVRMSALLLSSGVERMYWYLFQDFEQFQGLGLFRSADDPLGADGPAPAYVAYATLIRELAGARFVRREASHGDAYVCLFDGARGTIRVAWSKTPVQLQLKGPAQLVSIMGAVRPIEQDGGTARISLSETPLYIEGGAPVP